MTIFPQYNIISEKTTVGELKKKINNYKQQNYKHQAQHAKL